jgi:DNA-binding YbaB/EbfC family protein
MAGINKLLKEAAKMQENIQRLQSELAQRTVEASAGGGMIKVTAKGDNTIASIKIDPQAVTPDDVEGLEDLVVSGVNAALAAAKKMSDDEMAKATSGFKIPGM